MSDLHFSHHLRTNIIRLPTKQLWAGWAEPARPSRRSYLHIFTSRVSVDVAYHSDITKFIRNIEPHLSIRQRKQLKKEGKYSGQQDEYPSNLGPEEKPTCAEHVRQLSVSHLNPDRKNAQILYRYIEEALQNMRNIEVLEFETINE